MRNYCLLIIVIALPVISAALYGVSTPGGNALNVLKIDPLVGKATANVTTLYLNNVQGTCNRLLLSYHNVSQELAIGCDDSLYYVDIWWDWKVIASYFTTNIKYKIISYFFVVNDLTDI